MRGGKSRMVRSNAGIFASLVEPSVTYGGLSRFLPRPHHFALDGVIERNPGSPKFGGECGAKLLLQAPNHRIAKCDEVRLVHPESRVLATGMGNDRLKKCALVERADDGRDRVHQLDVLSVHVVGEQTPRIGSEFEEPTVKEMRNLATHRPDRIE